MDAPADTGSPRFTCVMRAWKAHQAELRGYLRHEQLSDDGAQDLVQEVFLRAMRAGTGFCALDNPRAWLFQVARNVLVDEVRRRRPVEPLTEQLPADDPEPLAPVDELATCLSRCLGRLRPEDQAVLRACDLEGQTTRAFAQSSQLTLAAAKSRLLRARRHLREQLTTSCQVRFDPDGAVAGHSPAESVEPDRAENRPGA